MDTGASDNFITKKVANALTDRQITAAPVSAKLADGSTAVITGQVRLMLKLGAYKAKFEFYVLDTDEDSFDIYLGDKWMEKNTVELSRANKSSTILKGIRKITVKTAAAADGAQQFEHPIISRMQLQRLVQNGCTIFLCARSIGFTSLETNTDKPCVQVADDDGAVSETEFESDFQSKLSDVIDHQTAEVLQEYKDVFPDALPNRLPPKRDIGHTKYLEPDAVPPYQAIYRMTRIELEEVKRSCMCLTNSVGEGLFSSPWEGKLTARGVFGGRPWQHWNGDIPIEACHELLIENSTTESSSSQLVWWGVTKCRRQSSTTLFILSVWPSVCGWNAVESRILVPSISATLCKKMLLKCGSLSQVISLGKPWMRHTLSKNSLAQPGASIEISVGTRCVILVSLSTKTMIALFSESVNGKPVMKSMLTELHLSKGICSGCSFPFGFLFLALLHWRAAQPLQNVFTSVCKSGHQNLFWRILSVRTLLKWPL